MIVCDGCDSKTKPTKRYAFKVDAPSLADCFEWSFDLCDGCSQDDPDKEGEVSWDAHVQSQIKALEDKVTSLNQRLNYHVLAFVKRLRDLEQAQEALDRDKAGIRDREETR